jgi:hypothetical protein
MNLPSPQDTPVIGFDDLHKMTGSDDQSITAAETEALERLIEIAKRDTGQSRRVADLLLAWWNQWSGATSKLLYAEYQAPAGTRHGNSSPARWVAWARTASGRIFVVSYFYQPDGSFVASGEPQRSTQTELVKTLLKGKRLDLVDQLELSKRPA